MKKEVKDKHFVKQPVYPGGVSAIRDFIKNNLQYPGEAMANRVEGTVHLRYDIDYKGNVVDAKIISGIGHGCDEEAVRLVKLLKFDVDKTRGVRVLFHKNIQIHFQLPKQQTTATSLQYNYTASAKKEDKPAEKQQGGSYSYTITIQ